MRAVAKSPTLAARCGLLAACLAAAALLSACGGDDPITPRACSSGNGNGTARGLQLFGSASYSGLSGSADSGGTFSFDPGEISFINNNLSPSSTTGSLRASLWALSYSYNGGTISGKVVGRYSIVFTGGGSQLTNGQSANLVTQTVAASTPSRGSYCMVATLEEYDPSSCPSSSDGYCIADWTQFSSAAQFE